MHFDNFIKDLNLKPTGELDKADQQHRVRATRFIQAILLLDTLDKDINCFSMKIREWYSWHFPKLAKIVNDDYLYVQVAQLVVASMLCSEDHNYMPAALTEILGDEDKAKQVVEAAGKASVLS